MWYADFQDTRIKMNLLLLRLQIAAGTTTDFTKVTDYLAKEIEKIYRDVYNKSTNKLEDKFKKKQVKLEVL